MSDLVYAQREIDNLINLLADARTENMRLNEYIKRQAMDILLCKSGNDTLHEENTRLRAALGLFACDCIESGNLCPSPQNCRNYIARSALEGK